MATDTKASAPALALYRLDEAQFHKMCLADVFSDSKVELLGGLLFPMVTNPPHNRAVLRTSRGINRLLSEAEWTVWEEKSARFGRFWIPSPDLAVARGPESAFASHLPAPGDLVLVVEVSDSTYSKDRGIKWRQYAAARIPFYWIENLAARQIEVHSDPAGRGKSAAYRQCQVHGIDAEVPVVIDGREVGRVAVKDLLP